MKKASTKDAFLAEYLKNSSLKATKGRKAVLQTVMGEHAPMSIDDIKDRIGISLDTATVYRILERFVNKKLVIRTDFQDGKAYFEYQKKHHHHITCLSCSKRENVEICAEENTKEIIASSKYFKKIESHMLEFFGICNKCAKASAV